MKYIYNPPIVIKKLFSSFQWESRTDKILITFDDGPVQGITELILKELDSQDIKAAFFCVGDNINKYPELAKEIISRGHLVGNHTYNHQKLIGIESHKANTQVELFNTLMADNFDYRVKYFRPPYGKFSLSTPKILRGNGLRNVMWSLLTYDFKNDFNLVKFAVDKYLQRNSIVVLHDNLKCKNIIIDSIRYVIDSAHKKGFNIGKPEECLKPSS